MRNMSLTTYSFKIASTTSNTENQAVNVKAQETKMAFWTLEGTQLQHNKTHGRDKCIFIHKLLVDSFIT